jgi:outer membrane protein W
MNAQIHEIGVFLGGSNYVGDIGSTTYVEPNEPAFGILYKWNKSPRHSYRFSYTQSKIAANDKESKEPSRNARGYSFKNNIKEVSLGLEFNFFDFNLHDIKKKITPYVYSGLIYVIHDELYLKGSNIETNNNKSSNSFGIPMNIGVKSNINPHTVLAFEVGARYTFTDNLDGSNPKNPSFTSNQFGNINNNDWYVFSGLTLTYTFGNTPCYCAE